MRSLLKKIEATKFIRTFNQVTDIYIYICISSTTPFNKELFIISRFSYLLFTDHLIVCIYNTPR